MSKQNIGLIGLAVMGQNLVLNMESKGYSVAVYNRTAERTKEFIQGKAKGKNIIGTYSFKELIDSLEQPRKIMLMVKAGKPVDDNIEELIPLLDKGDLIIDGGNSFYKDTIRREKYLSEKGLFYIGTGVSGGEEGALLGPAIMPGGTKEAYALVKDIFEKISAKAEDGIPCVSYLGKNGAGHFVKMVHNGIEYGDMQLIGECVWALKSALGYDAKAIADIIASWNDPKDILSSYLIEITGKAMAEPVNGSSSYLVDRTADITRMKGTGTWTVASALELLVPIPTIASAVFSREMSEALVHLYPENTFEHLLELNPRDLIGQGTIHLEQRRKVVAKNCELAYPVMFHGYRGLAVNTNRYSSETGNDLVTRPGVQIAIMFNREKDKWKYSLRSGSDDVDVSAIAKKFGGGGHVRAGGFLADKLFPELNV